MKTQGKIRILLADDHELILNGLKFLFNEEEDIEVVATAKNGLEALAILKQNTVDMVITDIKMPEMNGLELSAKIREVYPDIKVIVLTLYKDPEFVKAIIDAEADGYLLKNEDAGEIKNIIRHVMNDGTHFSKDIVGILRSELRKDKERAENTNDLSKREMEIIRLICQELSSVEIAERLFISKATVDVHRKNIIQKTGVRSLVGLIRFALENNIVTSL
ncbi:MAG: response regulator transcription factor [Sediminibacterium sp.]|nr:response regulator transcription factor [Sediminibacterium sp.]